jgi:hypothetical protein
MRIGKPIIIAVTPHGPPNSHLGNNVVDEFLEVEAKHGPVMRVEEFICLAAFIGNGDP